MYIKKILLTAAAVELFLFLLKPNSLSFAAVLFYLFLAFIENKES